MSHPTQVAWCESVRDAHPALFNKTTVLEVGSLNVNGTLRDLFTEPKQYIGVDYVAGPCVDVVGLFHELSPEIAKEVGGLGQFDVVCSANMLEHDPHATESLAEMVAHLRLGGLLMLTAPGLAFGEHGTTKTTGVHGIWGPDPDFYRAVPLDQLLAWLSALATFEQVKTSKPGDNYDTFFSGIKAA